MSRTVIVTRGYHDMKTCIEIFLRDKHLNTKTELTSIYLEIEDEYKLGSGTVERRLRNFVHSSWHLFPEHFNEHPTNSEFIIRIARDVENTFKQ